jgi:HSP20 family protein
MAIQRWDPMRDLVDLQSRIRRLFDDALTQGGDESGEYGETGSWRPAVDLFEDGDRYLLRADLPGVAPGDVEIHIEEDTLILRGARHEEAGVPREQFLRVERPHGRFAAQMALPPSVDRDGIQATHGNGVIEIVLPKRRPRAPNRVRVASAG